ncbi:MAG TPA: A/G-specific adenine glycosylase [Pricia sp.]|uniref:Adenine DNA glycosylase n=1 Tax=Pricia antarctica TaxID=641691 RepID=A0A831QNW8_9FLAO|nr:A/G-specific adenine glycosylase [Pricia sp.]HEA20367.1 A/G-specific adenine glycosylase [Pricia antarctica]
MTFAQKILTWYTENKRALPWRSTRDPYSIWLSEIILQQTRIVQGIPYYLKFMATFPTVYDLAAASEESVLKLWQGLGYYSRARNLHTAAKMVVEKFDGQFPQTYEGLLELNGVGDYTASAISSICFDVPEPVVDGNVYRVLARYFGIDTPINSAEGIKYFKTLARKIMDADEICDYNQGIMEFGAIQCTPKNPNCMYCPLHDSCVAFQKGKVLSLPVKINKTKIKHRYFNYLVFSDKSGHTLFRQRKGKGIWQNLWEFPVIEAKQEIDLKTLILQMDGFSDVEKVNDILRYNEIPIIHKLSHQHLHTVFWIVETDEILEGGIVVSELLDYPVPVLIADFLRVWVKS